jgi:hypothetical protein
MPRIVAGMGIWTSGCSSLPEASLFGSREIGLMNGSPYSLPMGVRLLFGRSAKAEASMLSLRSEANCG